VQLVPSILRCLGSDLFVEIMDSASLCLILTPQTPDLASD
jgi:hypothetical protein